MRRRDGKEEKGSEDEKEDKAPLGQSERKRISRDQEGVIGWGQRVSFDCFACDLLQQLSHLLLSSPVPSSRPLCPRNWARLFSLGRLPERGAWFS